MNTRPDPDVRALTTALAKALPLVTLAALAAVDPDDRWGGHALPRDHPAWRKDTVSLSQRAHALLLKLKPMVLHVIALWEHRARSAIVGGRRMIVDASGSYRLD